MAAESKATHGELRQAVRDLQNRGLLHSARWAAEQLYGLADEEPGGEDEAGRGFAPSTPAPPADDDAMEMETPAVVRPRDGAVALDDGGSSWRGGGCTAESAGDDFVLAKAYFDLGEYRRASHQLSDNRTSLGRFMRYYALYLAGEKRKNEEMLEVGAGATGGSGERGKGGPRPRRDVVNVELDVIAFDLPVILADDSPDGAETRDDPFLHYLYGLVLVEKDMKDRAREALCAACRGYPCNWGAWEAIMPLCATVDEARELPLPDHWMRRWFIAALQLELQENRQGPPDVRGAGEEGRHSRERDRRRADGGRALQHARVRPRAEHLRGCVPRRPVQARGDGHLQQHSVRQGGAGEAELPRAQRGAHRQVSPGDVLHRGQLLLPQGPARESGDVLLPVAEAQLEVPQRVDADGARVRGDEEPVRGDRRVQARRGHQPARLSGRGTVWARRTRFCKCRTTRCTITSARRGCDRRILACGAQWVSVTRAISCR